MDNRAPVKFVLEFEQISMIGTAMNLTKIAAVMFFSMICAAQAAPPKGLYGKTITITWNETRSQRDGHSGPFKPVSIPFFQRLLHQHRRPRFHFARQPRAAPGEVSDRPT